jgi:hypothetical protein
MDPPPEAAEAIPVAVTMEAGATLSLPCARVLKRVLFSWAKT